MDSSRQPVDLREATEEAVRERMRETTEFPDVVRNEEMVRMLHELQVHQVELESQNEELLRSRSALEESRSRYFELYHDAPVAYFTLDSQGLILELNRAAGLLIGAAPASLVMSPFAGLVAQDSQDDLFLHRQSLLADGETKSCELQMVRADGSTFWAGLKASLRADADGTPKCHAIVSDVSEQKHSYEALEKSADFTSSLIRLMQDGLVIRDLKGAVMDANPAFCEMTGFSRKELVGTGSRCCYWPPEECSNIQAALDEAMNGPTSGFEFIFMRKSGQRFPVIVNAFAVLDRNGETVGYAATVKDITLRKELEVALRDWNQLLEQRVGERTAQLNQSEARFRQLAEATFEGIVIVENGVIVDGNSQLAAIYGCELSEILGCQAMDLVAPESRSLVAENISKGVETSYEFVGLRKDGSKLPMEAHARMIEWQGRVTRVTALRDLTDQKQAAARLLAQQTALNQSMRLALVSEISAGIIHQIGQPLTAIMLHLVNAANQLDVCELKTCGYPKVLSAVKSEVIRMMEITSHLRALGDPEKPRCLPVDLNEMISKQVHLIRKQGLDRGIRLESILDDSIPEVSGDAVQLAQVVDNLLRNAVDACEGIPSEQCSIEVKTRQIPDDSVELCVSDNGGGIAPDVKKLLFTPFFTTKDDGLGIGLRLSRTIVEAHGGSIKALSNPDGPGTTFRVILPLGPESDYTKV